jgi:hypothetical protein
MQMLRWLLRVFYRVGVVSSKTPFSNLNYKIQSLDATQTPYGIACTDDLKVNKGFMTCAENDI